MVSKRYKNYEDLRLSNFTAKTGRNVIFGHFLNGFDQTIAFFDGFTPLNISMYLHLRKKLRAGRLKMNIIKEYPRGTL